MREIKFRMWDAHREQFVCDWQDTIMVEAYCFDGSGDRNTYPETPQQFTGLTDKNGVDIYEDDLIKNMTGRTGRVVWHEPTAGFDSMFVSDSGDHDAFKRRMGFEPNRWNLFIEVIGNIHENPELLKGE